MKNFLNNIGIVMGYNEKLYDLACENYINDIKAKDDGLDQLYSLILDKLVFAINRADAESILEANRRDATNPNWAYEAHPFKNFKAHLQSELNRQVLYELSALHRSEKYMSDFLESNQIRVVTDPFGSDDLEADDDLSQRTNLVSPIMQLCKKGKKAIIKRFEQNGGSNLSQRGE